LRVPFGGVTNNFDERIGGDEHNKAAGGMFRVDVATTYLQFLQLNELVLTFLPIKANKGSCVEIHYRVE
jgi:hypothetical protein